ncbi:Hypothetical predicted protein [Cloeon dipterum]|uniref:C2H2-type domain-containing protein n=1 Tax=Cloeon dipterum TaxID=197152 RepID=A0A8S1CWT3_9INSE|nr:Hypothetical predicted protein [Cloeon dipterum]
MKALKNKQKYKSTKRIQVATNCPGCGIFIGDAVFFKDHIAECSLVNPLVKTRVRCCPYEVLPDFKVAKCKSCNDHFPSMAAMYKHANNVHPETIHFKCSFCGFFFPSQKELDSHFTQMHERDSAVTKKLLARGTKSGTVISKKTCAINFLRASGKNLNSPTTQMRDASISTSKKVGRSESTISAPTLSSSFTISASKKAQEIDSRINGQNAHSDTSSFKNGQVTGSNRTPANFKPVKQGLIKCHQCTSVFESQLILNEHISLAHPPLRWHICFTCPDRPKFPSLSSLDAHIESGHSLGTTSSEGLVSRLPKMSTKQRVRSPKQKVSLIPTNLLKDDFRKAEKCQMCDFVSFSPETNQKHLEMFHPADQKSESLYCPLCNMTFVSKVVHLIHVSQCRGPRTKKSIKKLARKRRLCPSDEVGPSKSAPEPYVIDFRTHKTGNQESIVCDRVMKPVSPSSMKIRSLPNEDASTSSKSAPVMPCYDASSDVQAKKPRMSNVDEQRQSAAETTADVANAPCKRFPCYFCFSNLNSSAALIEHTKAMHNGVFVED